MIVINGRGIERIIHEDVDTHMLYYSQPDQKDANERTKASHIYWTLTLSGISPSMDLSQLKSNIA